MVIWEQGHARVRAPRLLLGLVGAVLWAQPPADFEAKVKAAMAPGIAEQRASIEKQASQKQAGASQFFTMPAQDHDPMPEGALQPTETAEEPEVNDPLDPQQDIEAGVRLLKTLLERYGNDRAVAPSADNAGSTRVDVQGGIPAIPETVDYVTAILDKLGMKAAEEHR